MYAYSGPLGNDGLLFPHRHSGVFIRLDYQKTNVTMSVQKINKEHFYLFFCQKSGIRKK